MKLQLLAGAALAVVASPTAARDRSAYFGIEAGPMLPGDLKVRGTIPNTNTRIGFDLDHKLGVDGDLIAGYDFGLFRTEVEGAYKWAKHDYTVAISGNTARLDNFGHTRNYSLMANGLVDLGKNDKFNVYAGLGVGMDWFKYRLDVASSASSFSDRGFAWQIIAGARAPAFRHFDVGVKYRYFQTEQMSYAIGPTVTAHNRFKSHSLLASLIYNFASAKRSPPPQDLPEAPPPPPAPPATQTCPDGMVILATDMCPAPPSPPPPPEPAPERGLR